LRTLLLDTGPVVAFLDGADQRHRDAVRLLTTHSGALLTSSAVVTEAMHFLGGVAPGPEALAEFVVRGRVQVVDLCQPRDLQRAALLMRRYHDTPMDFADATLVLLAEAAETGDVLTFDRRGFSTYRFSRNRGFRILV
jgi:predicted nucleic acid-binding protein